MNADFRCAVAAQDREDGLAGTASTVHSYLLVENAGPWGRDALLDSRLPEGLGAELKARAARANVRPLLIRRGRRSGTDEGIRVYAAHTRPGRSFLVTSRLASYHQLLDLDLGVLGRGDRLPGWRDEAGPLFATCTHGKHDACCAELGRPVAAALREAGVGDAWEVSHIGGDRFAANLLVLPGGFYYGGLDAENVLDVAKAHRDDRLWLDQLRGRSAYAMPVQYAEFALMCHLGDSRLGVVRLRSRERAGELTRVVFTHRGDEGDKDWLVQVRTGSRAPARLTCSALRENPVPVHQLAAEITPVESA